MVSARTSGFLWTGVFALVFLLSQDYWFLWDNQLGLGPWNFPIRIYYFIFLQFLLAVLLGIFLARRAQPKFNESDLKH